MKFFNLFIILYLISNTTTVLLFVVNPNLPLRLHHKIAGRKPSEISDYHRITREVYRLSCGLVPEGSVFLIGNSITQGMEDGLVAERAVNYGISGDTTVAVLDRLEDYRFDRASSVVLAVGVNDLKYRDPVEIVKNIETIVSRIPSGLPVVVSYVLYVDETANPDFKGFNEAISKVNKGLRLLPEKHPNVHLSTNESLFLGNQSNPGILQADGLHLTPDGVLAWSAELRKTLAEIHPQ